MVELTLIAVIAGIIGALAGLGGGVVLTPLLTLFFGIPIKYATGASLVSSISTSAGSASVYIKQRLANDRIGISLVTATTAGAIIGSLLANYTYSHGLTWIIYILFGAMLIFSIIPTIQRSTCELPPLKQPDRTTKIFRLYGTCYDQALKIWYRYWGVRWWLGWIIMFFAGIMSGLLGIGSGALKVLGMDWGMNIPMKVSTTSNFMIGVTAATSGSLYWFFGYITPAVAACTAIGVLLGARIGTRMLVHVTNRQIRWFFVAILSYLGIRMVVRGLGREGILPISSMERNIFSLIIGIATLFSLYLVFGRRYSQTNDSTLSVYLTQMEKPNKTEKRFIDITSKVLKYGVIITAIFLISGLFLLFLHGEGMGIPLSRIVNLKFGVDTSLFSINSVLHYDAKLDGLSFILTGLLVLIAIPIVMVAINLIRFIVERNRLYIALAAITLLNLMIAILIIPRVVV
ncbi:MAG: DUF1634 domain-containing protein [Thaumarchaeota archaeon]|jgi:uncharacterized membrane protein YfcA/uncharacterized membrane protein|nr:DUF1634 domain-containing protein [Nitrososphaerota archaeon]